MSTTQSVSTTGGFNASAAYRVNPRVAVRPESFGALLYHFGTRRLSFLKDRRLLEIVQTLPEHASAAAACHAAGVGPTDERSFVAALARLADSDMIVRAEPEGRA